MPQFCGLCGHEIKTYVKVYDGIVFDSVCHRQIITEVYEDLLRLIPYFVKRIFATSGEERANYRTRTRELIAQYRALSY